MTGPRAVAEPGAGRSTRRWTRLLATAGLAGAALLVTGAGAATASPVTSSVAAAVSAPGTLLSASSTSVLTLTSTTGVLTAAPAPAPNPSPSPSSAATKAGDGSVSINLDPAGGKPSQTITIILLLTVLSIAPAMLVLCTAFTKVIVVLSLTRNALGTPTIPPNQVLAGLALFLSLFIMAPVFSQVNSTAVQPYLNGELTQSQAYHKAVVPVRSFMMKETRKAELGTMIELSKAGKPATADDVPLTTLIPAFVLSELKSAFIIGFVIFIPFLVIDLVVSSSLMSMGMMMLPPVLISLPFKLLLFIMVDGWDLVAKSLVSSYH